jgi:hypothetical protein
MINGQNKTMYLSDKYPYCHDKNRESMRKAVTFNEKSFYGITGI